MEPLIKPEEFPSSLWLPDFTSARHITKKGALIIPEQLKSIYKAALAKLNLLDQATADEDDEKAGVIGGMTVEQAEEHFAKRFSASLGRVQLYALDPNRKFSTTLDALVAVFSAETIHVLDIPVGAGASTLTLVSMIAELRSKRVLEARPVKVIVTGGDISPRSRQIAGDLFKEIMPWWAQQNIDVTFQTQHWDVLDSDSTTDLTDKWLEGDAKSGRYVLVGGNFSGFLGSPVVIGLKERWMHRANSQLKHIIARGAKRKLQVFWVEPQLKQARKHFLPYLSSEIASTTKRLSPCFAGAREDESMMKSCLADDDEFITRAAGVHFKPSE
jgi:hypothetical protein